MAKSHVDTQISRLWRICLRSSSMIPRRSCWIFSIVDRFVRRALHRQFYLYYTTMASGDVVQIVVKSSLKATSSSLGLRPFPSRLLLGYIYLVNIVDRYVQGTSKCSSRVSRCQMCTLSMWRTGSILSQPHACLRCNSSIRRRHPPPSSQHDA